MATQVRALIIEDSQEDCDLLVRALRHGGYDVQHRRIDSEAELRSSLKTDSWDVVISDHSMPGFSGTAALSIVRENGLDIPFIFVSGTIGEDVAVNAMKFGAQDYIIKNNLARLIPAIDRELREAENRRERRRVEQRMRQLEKFEVMGKLAGGIAHDFNNVIGAVMGWAELGSNEVPAGSVAGKYFDRIRSQSARAAGLTRQLLAYARRQILAPTNLSLNDIIRENIVLLEKAIGAGIEVKMVLAGDICAVRADPSQIEQVLINLSFNARDAMPNGGQLLIETRNVDLDETYCSRHTDLHPGRFVLLSVSDTGTGMTPEILEHIFEPFFTTKEIGKGTGLGLATTFGVIKQHAGHIEVFSEPGKGTAFHIFVPAATGAVKNPKVVDEAPVRGGTETILIADDHEGVLEMAQDLLGGLGYHIISASDGEEAVQKFQADRDVISLVLIDVVMPKISGPEVAEAISRIKPGVPLLFTSGYSEDDALLESLLAKGAVMLRKPYRPADLTRRVRELLDASGH
jgi:two-component system, cell cycle sensor histidine kinase and response regulator CckA